MPLDMSAASAPPKRRTTATNARKTATAPQPAESSLAQKRAHGLQGIAQGAQLLCLMTKNYADAGTIGKYSIPLIQEIVNVAETDKYMAYGVDALTKVGPYSGLLMVAVPMTLQFLANHGRVNASALAGVEGLDIEAPEALDAKMRAHIARQTAEVMAAQREAEKAEAELRAILEEGDAKP